jgi:hypothetical protein
MPRPARGVARQRRRLPSGRTATPAGQMTGRTAQWVKTAASWRRSSCAGWTLEPSSERGFFPEPSQGDAAPGIRGCGRALRRSRRRRRRPLSQAHRPEAAHRRRPGRRHRLSPQRARPTLSSPSTGRRCRWWPRDVVGRHGHRGHRGSLACCPCHHRAAAPAWTCCGSGRASLSPPCRRFSHAGSCRRHGLHRPCPCGARRYP